MVRSNLAVLLVERNLKITKVSKDTNISRTTLTSLSNNYSQGIQFETLNTLCMYLKVRPDELIAYVPIDIDFKQFSLDAEHLEIKLFITAQSKTYDCGLRGMISLRHTNRVIKYLGVSIALWDPDGDPEIEKENAIITNAFNQLPRTFLTVLEEKVIDGIISELMDNGYSMNDAHNMTFEWDDNLHT